MGSEMDEAKGRMKQAAGDLTDDERLRREGKGDKVAGKTKEKIEEAKDKLEETVDDMKDRFNR